jgi:membrane protease YdiL (CAAX protease family)
MTEEPRQPATRFPWRLFWVLYLASVLSILAVVPASIDLFGPVLKEAPPPPFPLPLVFVLGAVQNLLLLGLFVGAGLVLARRLDLGPKLTRSWLEGNVSLAQLWSVARIGVLAGLGVGAVLLPMLLLLAMRFPALPFVSAARISLWKRVLMCFYGGVYEEVLTRLFLLSLFAWLLNRGWRSHLPQLGAGVFWLANLAAAVLFGLGHLPGVSMVMPITPLVVTSAILLNGIAGATFGYLYWKRGLESAMFAHFTADFVLYVLGPLFLKN